jgi:hypothetical protein
MNRFIEPAYRGAPARHWRLLFGKYKGKTLSVIPGWYLHFLLKQPRLDAALRAAIFETLQTASDRKHAVDEAVYKHAMKVTGSTPSNRVRKERKNA